MRWVGFRCIMLFLFVLLGCALHASAVNTAHISGSVSGPGGSPALQGLTVYLNGPKQEFPSYSIQWPQTTDQTGSFTFSDLEGGEYELIIIDPDGNWARQALAVTLAEDSEETVQAIMQPAAKFSGTVTGPDGSSPLEGISVNAYGDTESTTYLPSVKTDSSGSYTFGGLIAGTYQVKFSDPEDIFLPEYYDDANHRDMAIDITVQATTPLNNINTSLERASWISGTVSNAAGPVEGIKVTAYLFSNQSWAGLKSTRSDAMGNYRIGGLSAGTYRLKSNDYSGMHDSTCYESGNRLETATDIPMASETTVSNINIMLLRSSTISGTVTAADGSTPLQGIEVTARDRYGSYSPTVKTVLTDSNGYYLADGLNSGTYRITLHDPNGVYCDSTYEHETGGLNANDIIVSPESHVEQINASLIPGASISGTVTGPDGLTPLSGIELYAYLQNDSGLIPIPVRPDATSDSTGKYTIQGLLSGDYRVSTEDPSGDFISQISEISLNTGESKSIHTSLLPASKISGRVTAPDETTPLAGIRVGAAPATNSYPYLSYTSTDSNGYYTVTGLSAGPHILEFTDESGTHLTEFYDSVTEWQYGTVVMVPADSIVSNIDASLRLASHITGTVSDGSNALDNIVVTVYKLSNGSWKSFKTAYTDEQGHYNCGGLRAGSYKIKFHDYNREYEPRFYGNSYDLDSATSLLLGTEETLANINMVLNPSISISGWITAADSGRAL